MAQQASVNEDWLGAFDEHGVQFVIVDVHSDRELLALLQSQPEWTVDFQDGEGVIFARTEVV
jgi:hypothetical protein